MNESLKPILEINEKIKNLARVLELKFECPEDRKMEVIKSLGETMLLVKELEEEVIPYLTPKECYIAGKVLGRMEAIYSLIIKEVKDVREEK
jgi:hypothetical protein